jgi:hypothetical protein
MSSGISIKSNSLSAEEMESKSLISSLLLIRRFKNKDSLWLWLWEEIVSKLCNEKYQNIKIPFKPETHEHKTRC